MALPALLTRYEEDRTMILISHRLSCVQMADRIAVLESGSVVEIGSHAELLRRGTTEASTWKRHQEVLPR